VRLTKNVAFTGGVGIGLEVDEVGGRAGMQFAW
jgi:hypothetical protein